jgi:hypothetical protein
MHWKFKATDAADYEKPHGPPTRCHTIRRYGKLIEPGIPYQPYSSSLASVDADEY